MNVIIQQNITEDTFMKNTYSTVHVHWSLYLPATWSLLHMHTAMTEATSDQCQAAWLIEFWFYVPPDKK